eukprot:gene25828-11504_t
MDPANLMNPRGGGMNPLADASIDTPEKMLEMLEEIQRQGGNIEELVPPDLADLLQNVKKEKGEATDEVATETITPDPGFVVKTVDDTGRKVFINLCGSDKVAAPGNWYNGRVPDEVKSALENVDNLSDAEADTLRFPLSMGQAKNEVDKKGEHCTSFDCILNADVIQQAQLFRPLKVFIIELAINWIAHKTEMQLDKKYKLPKMTYKGDKIEAQRIRVDRKPLVEIIDDIDEEPTFPLLTKKIQPKAAPKSEAPTASTNSDSSKGGSSFKLPGGSASKPTSANIPPGAEGGQQGGPVPSTSAPAPTPATHINHSVEYVGKPAESAVVVVDLPANLLPKAGAEAVSTSLPFDIEVCGSSVYLVSTTETGPSSNLMHVSLPFHVSPSGYEAELEVSGKGAEQSGRLCLKLRLRSVSDVVVAMKEESPFAFGEGGGSALVRVEGTWVGPDPSSATPNPFQRIDDQFPAGVYAYHSLRHATLPSPSPPPPLLPPPSPQPAKVSTEGHASKEGHVSKSSPICSGGNRGVELAGKDLNEPGASLKVDGATADCNNCRDSYPTVIASAPFALMLPLHCPCAYLLQDGAAAYCTACGDYCPAVIDGAAACGKACRDYYPTVIAPTSFALMLPLYCPCVCLLQDNAAACCEACRDYQPLAGPADADQGSHCNTWNFCSDQRKCKNDLKTCRLRMQENPSRPQIASSGPDVPWTSGVVIRDENLESLFRSRGLTLVKSSSLLFGLRDTTSTLEVVAPVADPSVSFTMAMDNRVLNTTAAGFHHVGDCAVRWRPNSDPGGGYRLARTTNPNEGGKLAHPKLTVMASEHMPKRHGYVDLAPQLPPDVPILVQRWVEVHEQGSEASNLPEVQMWWNFTNKGEDSGLELGSVALSMPMDQYFADRNLETVARQCSFVEAYVGGRFGYIQVTKASGQGPTLLILPAPGTSFEAWRPLRGEDPANLGFGFEGHHELLLHSKAWATNEWREAHQWNEASAKTLAKGESALFGVRFILAPGPEEVGCVRLVITPVS